MRNKNAKVSNPNDFVSNSGDEYRILYQPIVNPDGTITLKESGKENIQEKINSFADQTDMSYILNQLALGNQSVLNQNQPMYGDFTQMPKSYAEVLQLYIDGQHDFDQLPVDVKNKFDNDFMKWFASAGSQEWLEKMNLLPKDNTGGDPVSQEESNE